MRFIPPTPRLHSGVIHLVITIIKLLTLTMLISELMNSLVISAFLLHLFFHGGKTNCESNSALKNPDLVTLVVAVAMISLLESCRLKFFYLLLFHLDLDYSPPLPLSLPPFLQPTPPISVYRSSPVLALPPPITL